MQGATQYWKPGEAKPQKTDGEELEKRDHKKKKRRRKDAQTDDRQSGGGGGGARSGGKARRYTDSQTPEQQGKYKGKDNIESKPSSGSKVASGPSQTLLAMKFMQRKAKVEEIQRQQSDKRKHLEEEFSTSFTKHLTANGAGGKDRLICRPDELDPALVFLGRRSFGGFNMVHETAYATCARDIASGSINLEEEDDDEHGISDMEMAHRLGSNMRGGRR